MKKINLTQGKFATIDDDDFSDISKHKWCIHANRNRENLFYAKSRIGGKNILMHRFLLNFPEGIIDHINGDGLDNRRVNLRIVTDSANKLNRRNCKGYNREGNGFRVKMSFNKKTVYRKFVRTEEEAISLSNSERRLARDIILNGGRV